MWCSFFYQSFNNISKTKCKVRLTIPEAFENNVTEETQLLRMQVIDKSFSPTLTLEDLKPTLPWSISLSQEGCRPLNPSSDRPTTMTPGWPPSAFTTIHLSVSQWKHEYRSGLCLVCPASILAQVPRIPRHEREPLKRRIETTFLHLSEIHS